MAVNANSLNDMIRIPVMVKTKDGGLKDLYFDMVQLDGVSYYEPVWPGRRTEDGRTQDGVLNAPVILTRNQELPRPAQKSAATGSGQFSTWFYGGR